MLPCLLISQNPYIARLLCYIVAESLNGKTPQSNKQKKAFEVGTCPQKSLISSLFRYF